MPHLDFARPSGQWSGEMTPGASDYQRWDVMQSKVVNGDGGGSYAPTKPIIIGGAGVSLTSNSTAITGGVTTATGGRVKLASSGITIPVLTAATTDSIVIPASELIAPIADEADFSPCSLLPDDYQALSSLPGIVGVQAGAVLGANTSAVIVLPGRYLHNASSIIGGPLFGSLTMNFTVLTKPASGGWTPPLIQVAMLGLNQATAGLQVTAPPPADSILWQSGHTYAAGAYVTPTTLNINGFYFKTTAGGVSGGSEPTWPTTIGATVGDGTVTWACKGRSGQLPASTTAADFFANGKSQSLTVDFDSPALSSTNICQSESLVYGIGLAVSNDTGTKLTSVNMVITSFVLAFVNIVDLDFT